MGGLALVAAPVVAAALVIGARGPGVDARATGGTTLVKPPGQTSFVRLLGRARVPFGTVVDVTHGTVTLTTSAGSGSFSAGAFVVRREGGVTQLSLVGGDFGACPAAKKVAKVVRSLWGDGRGRFQMKGRYATATVRGTIWRVEDRCDGTQTRVLRGSVVVALLHAPQVVGGGGGGGGQPSPAPPTTVVVGAGHSYLASA